MLSRDAAYFMSPVNMFRVERLLQPLDLVAAAPAASPSSHYSNKEQLPCFVGWTETKKKKEMLITDEISNTLGARGCFSAGVAVDVGRRCAHEPRQKIHAQLF